MGYVKKIGDIWSRHFLIDLVMNKKMNKCIELYHRSGVLQPINKLRAYILSNKIVKKCGSSISPRIKVGKNLKFVHCTGIVLGKTTEIGDNCKVFCNVATIAKIEGDDCSSDVRRHPKIGNDCTLGHACTLVGNITIGDDCFIGACAIVTRDVPAHSVVIGTNKVRPKRLDEIGKPYLKEFEESK